MGLENRRSGNVSEGSNPSLSAICLENTDFSSDDVSRCSRCVLVGCDGASVGTLTEEDWHWTVPIGCVGHFQLDLFERFLAKCGYTQGRRGRPPVMPSYMEEVEPAQSDRAWVYFARGRNTGLIKIGQSKQPAFRVSQLKHDRFFGDEAELLVTRRGDYWERAYHMVFEPWRFCGEWFAPHPDILAEIERLKGTAA
jgi:hypothetical protein